MSSKHSKKQCVSNTAIVKFINNKVGLHIDQEEKIMDKTGDFFLECFYRASINLGLADQVKITKQIKQKQKVTLNQISPQPVFKFTVVKGVLEEIFGMIFELDKIFNIDKNLVKDIFLAFINYNESLEEKRNILKTDLDKL